MRLISGEWSKDSIKKKGNLALSNESVVQLHLMVGTADQTQLQQEKSAQSEHAHKKKCQSRQ